MSSSTSNSKLHAFRVPLVVLAALAVTTVIFLRIGEVMANAGAQLVTYKRVLARSPGAIDFEEGKKKVLFMGNSKTVGGLVPEVFDEATGGRTHSYNMALPGLPLAPHYFLLEDYLKHQEPPDVVVIDVNKGRHDFFFFASFAILGANGGEPVYYSWINQNSTFLINYFMPIRFYFPRVRRFLMGRVFHLLPEGFKEKVKISYRKKRRKEETYPHDWDLVFETRFTETKKHLKRRKAFIEANRGHYFFFEDEAVGGHLPLDYVHDVERYRPEYKEVEDPLVDKFFELTEKHGVQVLLMESYEHEQLEGPDRGREIPVKEDWDEWTAKYDHVFYAKNAFKKKYYPIRDFSDPLHLTKKAAAKHTRAIAGEFREVFL